MSSAFQHFRLNPHSKFFLPIGLGLLLIVLIVSSLISYRYFQAKKLASLYVQDQVTEAPMLPLPSPSPVATSAAVLHVPILMYHYVEHVKDPNDTLRQKLAIYPETLDAAIKTLQTNGYTFMFASELAEVIDNKQPLPPKPVVLTFDDGYQDFYTDAFPIIKKYNVKVTAYIITGFIGKPNYMTLPQLQEVKNNGLVEIGAHTEHHIDLRAASIKQATQEIVGSQTTLEKLFGDPVLSFAYPSGFFNDQVVQIVKNAGFTSAVSTMPGTEVTPDNRLILFRLRAGSRTGNSLLQFLTKMTG